MLFEYRVISQTELVTMPSLWKTFGARAKHYAIALQDALNRMTDEGWQLVDSHKEPWSGENYFVFQRERTQESFSANRSARNNEVE